MNRALAFTVRPATTGDIPVLVELIQAEARESEGRETDRETVTRAITAALSSRALARYWVVATEDRVLGAISITAEWSDWNAAAYWWIQSVYLRPEARGRGLLGQLLEVVRSQGQLESAAELRLCVHPDNVRAIRAYEKLGFAPGPYRVMTMALPAVTPPGTWRDPDLWRAFQDRTLSHPLWTHQTHLRIAWMHLSRHEIDEAHLRMRVGIIRLNTAHGLEETAERGYHETLTRAWLAIVGAARRHDPCSDSASFLERHASSLGRDAPLRHYSRERIMSREARSTFVAPDLVPLP